MTGSLYIPGADRTSKWFFDDYPNAAMPRIDKTLLHSTETQKSSGCPGYSGGGTAPQVTINPWSGHRKIWQHFPINRPGRALGNPSSTPVSENKDNVFQVEIIGFSDPVLGRRYKCYLPEMSEGDIDYLVSMLAFVHQEWPHATTLPSTWPLYKVSSYTAMQAAHMTSAKYDAFEGILAHLHAPKPSTHGDVALDVKTVKRKLDLILNPPPPLPTPSPDMQEDTVYLVQITGQDPVYKSNGFQRVHIGRKQLAALQKSGLKKTMLTDETELDAYGLEAENPAGIK